MLNIISNNTNILEKTLDATWKRNEVISNNIANVDTPQFKRSNVSFEDELNKALDSSELDMKTTDQRHISTKSDLSDLSIKVAQDSTSLQYRLDGNNVDIESEMSDLAKNSIRYSTLIQKVSDEYKKLKYVISEGKK